MREKAEVIVLFLRQELSRIASENKASVPDVIEQWTDKQLWRFRTNYQSYLDSMDAVDLECDSDLMKEKLPHEGEDYLSVKRKIEAHATVMRRRANELLSKAKTQMGD